VQVFQPFRLTEGATLVQDTPQVQDGDQTLTLSLRDLPVGQSVAFTIDVDDTIGQREITVSGSEIAGARVAIGLTGLRALGKFDTTARAVIPLPSCVS
jgi:hypothetical protein